MSKSSKVRFLWLFLAACFLASSAAWAESIAVIVNKSNPTDEVSSADLARIFEAKMSKWSDGTKIVPVNREYSASVRAAFSELVHNKNVEKMKAYWYEEQYKGVLPPTTQESSVSVKRLVARVPGAVGYIYLSEVDDTVKVIKIDGLSCQDSGYKLVEK